METFKASNYKAHFNINARSHWFELECKHCDWTIAVPKRDADAIIADRRDQIRNHLTDHSG